MKATGASTAKRELDALAMQYIKDITTRAVNNSVNLISTRGSTPWTIEETASKINVLGYSLAYLSFWSTSPPEIIGRPSAPCAKISVKRGISYVKTGVP
jgi:hypothetical protein